MNSDLQTTSNNDKWLFDEYSKGLGLRVTYDSLLVHERTEFQDIKIVKAQTLGKTLLLNDWIYRTEDMGNVMPEMIAHVPMNTGNIKKKILLIGGGDGYTLAELVKYVGIENIDLVDIDGKVIEHCRKYFTTIAQGFLDNRVSIHILEGSEFLRRQENAAYDLILVTGTEAFDASGKPGISYPLFNQSFYQLCVNKLSPDGMLLTDGQNGFYGGDFYKSVTKDLKYSFPIVKAFCVTAKYIPGGLYVINIASKRYDPQKDIIDNAPQGLCYYTKNIHQSCFSLPKFLL